MTTLHYRTFMGLLIHIEDLLNAHKVESITIHNYPYGVIEEAVSNAVYHRNYEVQEPIEVRVLPDKIEVISYNGADPSLKQIDFDKGRVRARRYRNRRIGEFLKELELTEGRGTGIPRMNREMETNGSPKIIFDIDDPDRRYFIIEIPIHPTFFKNKSDSVVGEDRQSIYNVVGFDQLTKRQKEVLFLIFKNNQITYDEIKVNLKIASNSAIQKHIDALKDKGAIGRGGTRGGHWIIHCIL